MSPLLKGPDAVYPVSQAPIFISFFIALREMANLPVPSLQTGGLWWFQDLTLSDPIYVLPLVVTATMWGVLEVREEHAFDKQQAPHKQMHVVDPGSDLLPISSVSPGSEG